MSDDQDNDQRNEDEEDDDSLMRTYSKKKFFGKTTREIKPLVFRSYFKSKYEPLKPLKITIEQIISKITRPVQSSNTFKVTHNDEIKGITSKSKFNFSFKNHNQLQNYDISNTLSAKIYQSSLALHTKYNNKGEAGAKMSQSFKFWECWKLKYGLEYELKKESIYGVFANIQRKRIGEVPKWMSFASQYSEIMGISTSGKSNLKRKLEAFYKGHISTKENHKIYFQHKFGYDPTNASAFSNTLTANWQDNLGIGTLNASVTFENKAIKTKQFRYVIEFQKSLAFGLQRKNEIFELMMQKSKMKNRWVKLFRVNAGNRGLFSSIEGKINVLETKIDYSLGYKFKGVHNNFYDDSSLGFTFKWNL